MLEKFLEILKRVIKNAGLNPAFLLSNSSGISFELNLIFPLSSR